MGLESGGCPGAVRTGGRSIGLDAGSAATVFHAGTKLAGNVLETSGGRVLGVTARGPTLVSAVDNTYDVVRKIHFEGMHYRTDIGRKGLRRW